MIGLIGVGFTVAGLVAMASAMRMPFLSPGRMPRHILSVALCGVGFVLALVNLMVVL